MGVAWLHINGWVDQIGFGGPFGAKPGPPERFPLDRASAIAARVIARAFEIPGVDQFVFNAMLAHSDRQRKKP